MSLDIFSWLGHHALIDLWGLCKPLLQMVIALISAKFDLLGGLRFSAFWNLVSDLFEGNYLSIFYQVIREMLQNFAENGVEPATKLVLGILVSIFTLSFMYDGAQIAMGKGGNAQDFVGKLLKFYIITGAAVGWGSFNSVEKVYDVRDGVTKMVTSIFVGDDASKWLGNEWGQFAVQVLATASQKTGISANTIKKSPVAQMDAGLKLSSEAAATAEATKENAGDQGKEGSDSGIFAIRSMQFGQTAFTVSSLFAMIVNEVFLALLMVLAPFFIFCLNFQFSSGYFRNWFNAVATLILTYALVTTFVTLGNLFILLFNVLAYLTSIGESIAGFPITTGMAGISQASTIIALIFGLLIIKLASLAQTLFGSNVSLAANDFSSRISGAMGRDQSNNADKQTGSTPKNVGSKVVDNSNTKADSRADLSTPDIPPNVMSPTKKQNINPDDFARLGADGKPIKNSDQNNKNN